jgi:hypothetical protein
MNENLPVEQRAYGFPEIWEEDWFPPQDHARIRALVQLIRAGMASLPDAGCGNGLPTIRLRSAGS